jgi:hypothetical protein
MNDSRELILGRIRERLGRSPANALAAAAAIDAALAAPAKRCALNQVITVLTLAGDMGKWRKRLPLS